MALLQPDSGKDLAGLGLRRALWLFALLLVALSAGGCVNTHVLAPGTEAHRAFGEDIAGRGTEIELRTGASSYSFSLSLQGDSLHWRDRDTRRSIVVHTCEVASVTVFKHGLGAAEGLGIGIAAGAVVGAIAMLAIAAGDCGECFVNPAFLVTYGAAYGALRGILIGAPLFTLVGAASAHRERYEFAPC